MGDPLSITASVIGILQLVSVCQSIYEFASDVRNHQAESNSLLIQCQSEEFIFKRWKQVAGLCSPKAETTEQSDVDGITPEEYINLENRFRSDPLLAAHLQIILQHVANQQAIIKPSEAKPDTAKIPKFIRRTSQSFNFAFTKGRKLRSLFAILHESNNALYRLFKIYEKLERLREVDMTRHPEHYLQMQNEPVQQEIAGLCNLKLLCQEESTRLDVSRPSLSDEMDFQGKILNLEQDPDYSLRSTFETDGVGRVLVEWRYITRLEERDIAQIRLRKLITMLQYALQLDNHKFRVLPCLGTYFDESRLRFGIVFRLTHVEQSQNPVKFISLYQQIVQDRSNGNIPSLGCRFRLAEQLCRYVSYLLLVGWLHKSIRSDNVLFLSNDTAEIDPNPQPFLAGFDIARQDLSSSLTERPVPAVLKIYASDRLNRYRHPEAIIRSNTDPAPTEKFKPWYDLWSLGIVLIEIAYWIPISSFHKRGENLEVFRSQLLSDHMPKLRGKVGDLYLSAVMACLDGWPSQTPEERIYSFDSAVLGKLKRCVA